MKTQYADLHSHTFYSDGMDTPEQNVRNAARSGLGILAITDHDTTRGYEEAKKEAEKYGIEIIPGVEVTTRDYHILGLGIDVNNRSLQKFLEKGRYIQEQVCRSRTKKLAAYGAPIEFRMVRETFPTSRLGKCNIFYTMMESKEGRRYLEEKTGKNDFLGMYFGFMKLTKALGKDNFPGEITPEETIKQIHQAGGIAILAHPALDIKDMSELDKLVEQGIDGLEVQPNYIESYAPYEAYACERGLKITRGSDFHGQIFAKRPLLNRDNALRIESLDEFFSVNRTPVII